MDSFDLTLSAAPTILTASASGRTISGTVMQYGVVGNASLGPCIFEAGSITVPDPINKVKMLVQHDYERPVGILASLEDGNDYANAVFNVPAGAAGDQALTDAAAGLRDGLSVGVHITEYAYDNNDNLIVKAAVLTEVSLVTVPAFENALVNNVAANRKKKEMETENAPLVAAAEAVATPSVEVIEAQAAPVMVAANKGMSLEATSAFIAKTLKASGSAAALNAALTDLVPADDKGELGLSPVNVGELWTASKADRPMVDAFGTPGKLTGLKVYGSRFVTKAKIEKYAGNKTDIASGKVTTEMVEGDAQDFAAGWDVARKFIDLGDPAYINAILKQATDDYKVQTDDWFTDLILADATPVAGATTVLTALTKMTVEASKIGSKVTTFQFATDVWEQFISMLDGEVPWWLKAQGDINISDLSGTAGGMKFRANTNLAAGQILGNDRNAATFYEAGSAPIRVQALDIPRGGVDLGVFGYAAAIVHDPRAIFLGTVAP